jgi:predicted AAA+ superfamily ATPase
MVIADLYKQYANRGRRSPLYFWRDQNGRLEVDCIVDRGISLIPIEIKSGQTFNSHFFDGIKSWAELTESNSSQGYVVYGGDKEMHQLNHGYVIGWQDIKNLVDLMEKNSTI